MRDAESTRSAIRTIRLSDDQVADLMDRLDGAEHASSADASAREYAYRRKGLIIDILQPGAVTPTRYAVQPRRINETELRFLHGSFLHTGTRCCVQLVTLHGTWTTVSAVVTYCTYLEENIHDVRVQFSQRIDPALFCPDAGRTRVLLVEQDESLARLVEFHLSHLNADVEHIKDSKRAGELVGQNRYDVILFDVEMNDGQGFEVVKKLRSQGYSQTIVAFSALVNDGEREKSIAAGCDLVLAKPFTQEDVRSLLQSLRREPLFSSFYNDPAMTELINAFVQELSGKVREIEQAARSGQIEVLRGHVRTVRAQGSSYGFEVLTEAAATVEEHLTEEITPEVRSDLDYLVKLCMQARCADTGSSE
ncbi:MAG: response regulator [Planctomycetes bacterium]|nr:response regulator [Planctomycetota bacterium]